MGTGAKIAIVLGLLLIVIGFVRYLDDDISDEMSQDGKTGGSLANGPDAPDNGFRELGQVDPIDPAPESGGADSADDSSALAGDGVGDPHGSGDRRTDLNSNSVPPVVVSPAFDAPAIHNAALRPVRPQDRENGFVGPVDPAGAGTVGDVADEDPQAGFGATTEPAVAELPEADIAAGNEVLPDDGSDLTDEEANALASMMGGELDRRRPGGSRGDRASGPNSGGYGEDYWKNVRPIGYDRDRDGGEPTTAGLDESNTARMNRGDRPDSTPVIDDPAPVNPEPSVSPEPAGSAVATGFPKEHKVETNDRVWDLAGEYYGRPALFKLILDANPSIGDGSRLKVGQVLTIPAPPATTTRAVPQPPTTASTGSYVVKKGDRLYNIAERLLGSGPRWREIARANPTVDPDRLRIGTELVIPPK